MVDSVNLTVNWGSGNAWAPAVSPRPQSAPEGSRAAVSQETSKPADTTALEPALRELSDHMRQNQADVVFQYDKDSGLTYFKIVSAKTGEVIRQVPAEEIITMARKLRELANPKDAQGVLMDQES